MISCQNVPILLVNILEKIMSKKMILDIDDKGQGF